MKIIIWGFRLHSHTSSYVHYGFYRAFKDLGYEAYWFDDNDDVSHMNFDNSVFITEGQVDSHIPLNKTCKYFLHNCRGEKYAEMPNKMSMQFFHNSIVASAIPANQHTTFSTNEHLFKINDYTYANKDIIYQPWATDLLPQEIDLNTAHNEANNKECVWIGTYGGGDSEFQNHSTLDPFFNECKKHNIRITRIDPWAAPVSPEKNREMVNKAFFAPTIQGPWQVKNGYLPCRLFKNISYGHMSVTNNPMANAIFDNKLIFDNDPVALFHKAMQKKSDPKLLDEIKFLMNEVKEKHTYINRAKQLISLI